MFGLNSLYWIISAFLHLSSSSITLFFPLTLCQVPGFSPSSTFSLSLLLLCPLDLLPLLLSLCTLSLLSPLVPCPSALYCAICWGEKWRWWRLEVRSRNVKNKGERSEKKRESLRLAVPPKVMKTLLTTGTVMLQGRLFLMGKTSWKRTPEGTPDVIHCSTAGLKFCLWNSGQEGQTIPIMKKVPLNSVHTSIPSLMWPYRLHVGWSWRATCGVVGGFFSCCRLTCLLTQWYSDITLYNNCKGAQCPA